MALFWRALWATGPSTPLSRYTFGCGVFYALFGLVTFAWPGSLQSLMMAAPFRPGEEGLVRVVGFLLALVGWFYIMGARTRADSFGLATVADRLVVPVFLLPLGLSGQIDMHLAVPFSILDPLLALGALLIWRRSRSDGGSAPAR